MSLSFDDARPSQIERGVPLLNEHGVRATFYVSFPHLAGREEDWKRAIEVGHEIGNHTVNHPCSGNFVWSRANALEDYTLERMETDIWDANTAIQQRLGVTPTTFAYPCGQTYVGRGEQLKSYVPLVARHFMVGRGFKSEMVNDPTYCDLALAAGVDGDCIPFDALKQWIESARETNGWVIFACHNVGEAGKQTITTESLEALCHYVNDENNAVWIDTVANIGGYIKEQRAENQTGDD